MAPPTPLAKRDTAPHRWTGIGVRVLSVALLLACWQVGEFIAGPAALPGPVTSLLAFGDALGDGFLWGDIGATAWRMAAAFALGGAAGLGVGILLGCSAVAASVFGVWVPIAASVPALIYVVAAYLTLGISDAAAVVAVAVIVAPTVATAVWDGIRSADPGLGEMARSFGVGRWHRLRQVTLPQAAPWLFAAARSGWSLTWRIMIFVELIGRSDGVGYRIQYWFNLADMPRVVAAALPLVALVVVLDVLVFRRLERRLARWRPAAQG